MAAFSLPPADEAIELVNWRYCVVFVRGLDVHLTLNLTISVFLTNTKMILLYKRFAFCFSFILKVFKMSFFLIKKFDLKNYHFDVRLAGEQFVHEGFLGNNGQNANDKHDWYEKPGVCGAPLTLHQPVDVAAVG